MAEGIRLVSVRRGVDPAPLQPAPLRRRRWSARPYACDTRVRQPARAASRWGHGPGPAVRRLGAAPALGHAISRGPRQAQLDGFDLHANVWVDPNDRARLEQLCRYLVGPP